MTTINQAITMLTELQKRGFGQVHIRAVGTAHFRRRFGLANSRKEVRHDVQKTRA